MDNTKVSRLLMAWLYTQGHEVEEFIEGSGVATKFGKSHYRFDIDGNFGGYRTDYHQGKFSFYDGDKLLKETNLNEFR
jgi:hypothetical protein|tara:strand:- start:397 stop:630 length:234 start_codon:yes stop_codon:yes gene_type:complete